MEDSKRDSFIKNITDILQYFKVRTDKLVNGSGDPFNCENISYKEKAIVILSRMTPILTSQNENEKALQDSANIKSTNNYYQNSFNNYRTSKTNNSENKKINDKNRTNLNKAISIEDLHDQLSLIVRERKKQNQNLKNVTQIQIQQLYTLRFASNKSRLTSEGDEALRNSLDFQQKAKILLEQSTQAQSEINMLEIENKNLEQSLITFQRIHQRYLNKPNNATVSHTKKEEKPTDFSMSLREQQARINKARSSIEKLQHENEYLEMRIDSYEKRIKSMKISTDLHLSLADRALMNIPTKISTDSIKSNENEFNPHRNKKTHKKRKNRNNNDENDHHKNYDNESERKPNDTDFNYNSNDIKKSTPRRKTHNNDNENDQCFTNEDQNQNDNNSYTSNDHKNRKHRHRTHKNSNKNEDDDNQFNDYIKNDEDDKNIEYNNYDENYSSLDHQKHIHKHRTHKNDDNQSSTNNDQNQPDTDNSISNGNKKRVRRRKTHKKNTQNTNDDDITDIDYLKNAPNNQNDQQYENNQNYHRRNELNESNGQTSQRHRKRIHKHRNPKNDDELNVCQSDYSYTSNERKKRSHRHSVDQNEDEKNTINNYASDYSYTSNEHKKRSHRHSINRNKDKENTGNNFASDYSYTSNEIMKRSHKNLIKKNEEEEEKEEEGGHFNASDYSYTSNEIKKQNQTQTIQNEDDTFSSSASSITHINDQSDGQQNQMTTIVSAYFGDTKQNNSTQRNTQQQQEQEQQEEEQDDINKNDENALKSEVSQNSDSRASSSPLGLDSHFSCGGFGTSHSKTRSQQQEQEEEEQPPQQQPQPQPVAAVVPPNAKKRVVMPERAYKKPQPVCRLSTRLMNMNRNQASSSSSSNANANASGSVSGGSDSAPTQKKDEIEMQPTKTAKEAAMEVVEIIQQFKAMLHGEAEYDGQTENETDSDE